MVMRRLATLFVLVSTILVAAACEKTPPAATPPAPVAPEHDHDHNHAPSGGAPAPTTTKSVAFAWPMPGSKVFSTFDVRFAVTGMAVRPAGEDVMDKSSGHHHLLIDTGAVPAGQVIPKDETHLHFGKGETTTSVTLTPGPHQLQMQLADGAHISYGPELSAAMDVTVVQKPAEVGVFFANLKDGDVVAAESVVEFGVKGFTLRPALEDVLDKTSGHHHLIIDDVAPALGEAVAKDDKHIHFGKAETKTTVKLSPGTHTLTLQLADGAHLSYGPSLSTTIKVMVK
jgi:hypothetical protein